MEQDSRATARTGTRRFLHALRPFLMLGGFVVVWWCLATGTAQAADNQHHELGTTAKALTGSAGKVLHSKHQPTRIHHAAPRATHKATAPVRQHVAPVVHTVRATVAKTPVAKVVKTATHVVRTTTKPVIAPVRTKAHEVLASTPIVSSVVPQIDGPDGVTENLPVIGESSTLQGETASQHAAVHPVIHTSSAALADASLVLPTTPSTTAEQGLHHAAPSSPISPADDEGSNGSALGATGSTGTSSVQSGSGAGSPAALLESGLINFPVTDGALVSAPAGRLIAGPAYPPSSSPD